MTSKRRLNKTNGATANADRPQPVRIFVAIKITPEIADELAQVVRGLERIPVRLVAPADTHLTLVPPWNETSIPNAVEKLRRVADSFDAFALPFQRIGYGPEPKRPRFLWAECAAGQEVADLRSALLRAFGQTDERLFLPHVTLARLRDKESAIARKHFIDQNLSLAQQVESIELMQSPLSGERGYKVIASLRLGRSPKMLSDT